MAFYPLFLVRKIDLDRLLLHNARGSQKRIALNLRCQCPVSELVGNTTYFVLRTTPWPCAKGFEGAYLSAIIAVG